MTQPNIARFWSKVNRKSDSECWEWTGYLVKGYGQFDLNGKPVYAHRLSYQLLLGPILAGRELDHLCRNSKCVNPNHLEVVTSKENTLRGVGISAQNARKTHCVHGHLFDDLNTCIRKGTHEGARSCRICNRIRTAKQERNQSRRRK
jgi:hypothetical protein